MTTPVSSPEWLIFNRTLQTVRDMASRKEFVRSEKEAVMSVRPAQVLPWKTLEGGDHNQQAGFVNLPVPAMLITPMTTRGGSKGSNHSDDEIVTIVVQVVDSATGPTISQTPIRTYMDWMNRIRHTVLESPRLFRQDFNPAQADPYLCLAKDRVPSDPQRLWTHEQQVAAFSFLVKVRHSRAW